jgi:hypothetical protein
MNGTLIMLKKVKKEGRILILFQVASPQQKWHIIKCILITRLPIFELVDVLHILEALFFILIPSHPPTQPHPHLSSSSPL